MGKRLALLSSPIGKWILVADAGKVLGLAAEILLGVLHAAVVGERGDLLLEILQQEPGFHLAEFLVEFLAEVFLQRGDDLFEVLGREFEGHGEGFKAAQSVEATEF